MTVKEYLSQVQELEERMIDQRNYVNQLRESLTLIGVTDYSKDRVQSSPEGDTIGKRIAKVLEEEDKLKQMQKMFCVFRSQVIDQIHAMDDLTLKQLLILRYICWKDYDTLLKVSEKMGYSYKYIIELHDKALLAFNQIFLP